MSIPISQFIPPISVFPSVSIYLSIHLCPYFCFTNRFETCLDLEAITQSEVSQKEENECHVFTTPLLCLLHPRIVFWFPQPRILSQVWAAAINLFPSHHTPDASSQLHLLKHGHKQNKTQEESIVFRENSAFVREIIIIYFAIIMVFNIEFLKSNQNGSQISYVDLAITKHWYFCTLKHFKTLIHALSPLAYLKNSLAKKNYLHVLF